jgi:hypothetical protein
VVTSVQHRHPNCPLQNSLLAGSLPAMISAGLGTSPPEVVCGPDLVEILGASSLHALGMATSKQADKT